MTCDDAGCKVYGVHRGDNVDFTYNFVNKIDVCSFHKHLFFHVLGFFLTIMTYLL